MGRGQLECLLTAWTAVFVLAQLLSGTYRTIIYHNCNSGKLSIGNQRYRVPLFADRSYGKTQRVSKGGPDPRRRRIQKRRLPVLEITEMDLCATRH
jgi:hypothetical protein